MALKKKMNDTIFRLKVRKALSDSTAEQVKITMEECKRYFEKKGKK